MPEQSCLNCRCLTPPDFCESQGRQVNEPSAGRCGEWKLEVYCLHCKKFREKKEDEPPVYGFCTERGHKVPSYKRNCPDYVERGKIT